MSTSTQDTKPTFRMNTPAEFAQIKEQHTTNRRKALITKLTSRITSTPGLTCLECGCAEFGMPDLIAAECPECESCLSEPIIMRIVEEEEEKQNGW